MTTDPTSPWRAGLAFATAVVALIPLAFAALLLGVSSESPVISSATVPLVFFAQWAFPRSLARASPYTTLHVPGVVVLATWLCLTAAFAYCSSRARLRRPWLAASLTVPMCVVIANIIIRMCGFHVSLDGP